LRTDARIAYLRHELGTRLTFATIVQGSQLELNGRRLLASECAIDAKISSLDLNNPALAK
jgi:hypothetical protein